MKIKQLALAVSTLGGSAAALAGGFALNDQSVSAMGAANAGRASLVEDASVVYNNPAAMGELKGPSVSAGTAFIKASTKIKNASGGIGGTNNGDIVPETFIPSGYYTTGNLNGLAYGLAAYGSFGLKTNYESTYAARYLGDKSSVKVTTLQPSVSFKVNESLSLGAAVTINKLEAYLSKFNPQATPVAPGVSIPAGTAELEGDDMGYGYTLSLHTKPSDATSIGVVYRSKVKYKIDDGSVKQTGVTVVSPAFTSISTPESVEASLSYRLSDKNTLHAASSWTRWSRLANLTVTNSAGTVVSQEVFNWKDSEAYSVGLTHRCDEKLTLRAGLAYDNSPVAPADRSVRLPSADRRIASIGVRYALTANQSVDASYSYVDEEKASVNHAASLTTGPAYTADYHNSAHVFGAQYNYTF